jgi:hypothetical protein
MPADYVVEVRAAGHWRDVDCVRGNRITEGKIALHQFPATPADAVRLTITRPVDPTSGVLLRATEIYSSSYPPLHVAEFLSRETPGFVQSRSTVEALRAE